MSNGKSGVFPLHLVLGMLGAVAGGILGYFAFKLLLDQNFYALALPGALLGMGCGILSGRKSYIQGALCCVASVILAIVVEWRFFPMVADGSFTYFLSHMHQLKQLTIFMIVLSGIFGFWFGMGRDRFTRARRRTRDQEH